MDSSLKLHFLAQLGGWDRLEIFRVRITWSTEKTGTMAVALLKCDFANGAGKMHLFETQAHSADSPGATTLLSVKQVPYMGYDTSALTSKCRL